MNIEENNLSIIQDILQLANTKDIITNDKKLDETLLQIYGDINKSYNYINKNKSNILLNIKKYKDVKKPQSFNSYFFPDNIKYYIDINSKYVYYYSFIINKRIINVHFILNEHISIKNITKKIHLMYLWLYICTNYSSINCLKKLNIYIYLTPFKKILPSNKSIILGPDNVNTGYTQICPYNGEIIIYRKEEWFKVFIHESMHTFGFDKGLVNNITNRNINDIFPISVEIYLNEAYSETWARIITSAINSYLFLENKSNKTLFLRQIKLRMEIQRYYSLLQMNKILKFMDLNYILLYDKSNESQYLRDKLYREKTNVFSYYVLTSIFMNNYSEFLKWCKKNNDILYKFKISDKNINNFINILNNKYDNKSLLNDIKLVDKYIKNKNNEGLTMTIVNV